MNRQAGPPPVQNRQTALTTAERRYEDVRAAFQANDSAEVRAMYAMFNNDRTLLDRFLATTFSLLAKNSSILRDCTTISIVQSIKDAASWGLEPLTDECALIAYGDRCEAQPMWRGYLKRIRNSGKVTEIDCQLVYEDDEFELGLGTDPFIRHVPKRVTRKSIPVDPNDESKGTRIVVDEGRGGYHGAYAWALMPSGKTLVEWMSIEDIIEIRDQHAKGLNRADSPWNTSFGEMARKTVIRRLAKRLPGAAVDVLLRADQEMDRKTKELTAATDRAQEATQDLRQMAMRATGLIAPETTVAGVPEPQAEEVAEVPASEPAQPETAAPAPTGDPGADPNVGAAMEMARQQDQMRRGPNR